MKIEKGNYLGPRIPFLKVAAVLIFASMIAAVAISTGTAMVDKRPTITLTGIVSDSICGSDHGISAPGDAECTRSCVELGAQYALVVGDKMYVLQGHQADLDRFAGATVRLTGRAVSRDKVLVDQVAPWYSETAEGVK